MGHLRTRTLEAFKESFDKALEKEGFAAAARDCTQTFLEKFDKGSEGMFSGTLVITTLFLVLASSPLEYTFWLQVGLTLGYVGNIDLY